MKYLFLRLFIASAFTTVSFNLLANDTTGSLADEPEIVVQKHGEDIAKKEIDETDSPEIKSWDSTLSEVSKKTDLNGMKNETHNGSGFLKGLFKNLGKITLKLMDKITNVVPKKFSIDFNLDTDVKIIDGLELGVGHGEEIGPAFYGDYHSRMDAWTIGPKLNVLELFGVDSKFGLNIRPELEVRFYQFFKTIEEARDTENNIYLPSRVPLTAESALQNLKPGDLVALDGDLRVTYGYLKVWDKIRDWLKIRVGASGAMIGRLRMFIFRADDGIVRLRVSALRSSPKSIHARISIFDLFDLGWGRLTELVENALNLDSIFKGDLTKVDQDLWLADYTLDLNDPRVRSAYDAVFSREERFSAIFESTNPFTSESDLREKLWNGLRPLTELAVNESNKSEPKAVINFMGSNFSDGGSKRVEAGIRGAWRGEKRQVKQENRLKQKLFDADGQSYDRFYFYPSWVETSRLSALATRVREKKHQAANMIYTADENHEIQSFESIGFYREETDQTYNFSEHEKTLRRLKALLPNNTYNDFYDELDKNNWTSFSKRDNVRISMRYFITEKGLKLVEGARSSDIQNSIVKLLHDMDMDTKVFVYAGRTAGHQKCNLRMLRKIGVRTWAPKGRKQMKTSKRGQYLGEFTQKYCKEIKKVAEKLEVALSPSLTAKQRHKAFSSFTNNRFFRRFGSSVLFDILGGQRLDEEVSYFEFVINSSEKSSNTVRYSAGKIENRPLYEIILQMERILGEDEPDMRLPGDQESLIRKKYDNLEAIQTI